MSIDLVLCATDLSQEEGTAWRSAARLVQALDARARIFHVIEPVTFPTLQKDPAAKSSGRSCVNASGRRVIGPTRSKR
jgi:hypothetical protein